MEQRVKICDIAEELGLSTATVSNVIHGKTNKVSDATVQRVMALLELTIQRGVEEGVFPPPRSLRYAVLAMLSGLTGYVSYRRVHPQEPGLEQDTIELISRALA